MAAVLAYLMLKLTGVDREMVEKWIYGLAALSLFTGILGTGHHYYWIGTPAYWQWIGSVFSAMEVIPFFAMVLFVFTMVWKGQREHPNKAALLWALGCAVLAFFGAGVWGFLHTLSPINYWTHGTQVTMSHGHLAFFGAYVSLNLAFITYAMPYMLNREPYNQVLNMVSFWLMAGGITFMTFALTFAGAVQTHLQRVRGENFMDVQDELTLFYIMRELAGVILVIGVAVYLYSVFVPRKEEVIAPAAKQPAE